MRKTAMLLCLLSLWAAFVALFPSWAAQIPGSEDYYAAAWHGLIKNREAPSAPNPEGRDEPFLMKQTLPVIQSGYGGAGTSGAPFVRAFSERMQSPDQATRLEAYFRSVGLPELPEYVGILQQAQIAGDELERLTALYAMAVMTRRHEDIDAFLSAFPSDPALFYRFFDAEWELSGTHNTGVANFLLLLAYEPRTQGRALPCLARLAYTNVCGPAEFLTAYREDPLVAAYMAEHGESLLVRDPEYRIETQLPQTDWHAFMLSLMRNDDLLTATTALLMEARFLRPGKTPEVLRLQGTLFEPLVARIFDNPRFMDILPLTAKELPDLLSVEKQVYRPPLDGIADSLIGAGTDSPQLRALWHYGRDFLAVYELQRIEKILGKSAGTDNAQETTLQTKVWQPDQIKTAKPVVARYMRENFGWADEEFDVKLYDDAYRNLPTEPHVLKFEAVHRDDLQGAQPRGGKSRLVEMDMENMKVLRVWAFQ